MSRNSCNNCGKHGHQFHQCRSPITSYGIVAVRFHPVHGPQYLMIRRKNSFGYIEFIRGKYVSYNLDHLQQLIDEMSNEEKHKMIEQPFETLCCEMWGDKHWRNENDGSRRKFENLLNNGITTESNGVVRLNDMVLASNTSWSETEWEFPKGRRNSHEKDIDCAIREFQEETGYPIETINIIKNIAPFEEIFIGSNHKSYKHKYYVAIMNFTDACVVPTFQQSEVSKLEWKSIDKCLADIRPYSVEKKSMLQNIHTCISQHTMHDICVTNYTL